MKKNALVTLIHEPRKGRVKREKYELHLTSDSQLSEELLKFLVGLDSFWPGTPKPSVNIRVFRETRDRLKVKAARKKISIMQLVKELSIEKHGN